MEYMMMHGPVDAPGITNMMNTHALNGWVVHSFNIVGTTMYVLFVRTKK